MADYFKNILIPVDLSVNTEVAVKKGLELAEAETSIHLLHVQNYAGQAAPNLSTAYRYLLLNTKYSDYEVKKRLEQWKEAIEEYVAGIKVRTWRYLDTSIQETIERKAKQLKADLVIIGKNSHHSWLPFLNTVIPSKIAQHTGIPVLTVKPGSIHSRTKTIIVPIASDRAEGKIEAISAICRKFMVKIYLVSFMDKNKPSDFYASSLLEVYRRLRLFTQSPVEYTVLHGHNKAKAILNFAKSINADMLLVHPETETKIGWPDKHISDVLLPDSKVQVLAV